MRTPTLPDALAGLPVDAHGRQWRDLPGGAVHVRRLVDGAWRCVAYATPDPAIPGWRVTPAIGARPEWAETRDAAIARLDEATMQ